MNTKEMKRLAEPLASPNGSDSNASWWDAFHRAANPAAILALIAEIDSLRDQVNGLTGEIEAAEKTLRQSRANDREAMSWIADCKEATGYHGSLMPSFVEYLRDLKQRADK